LRTRPQVVARAVDHRLVGNPSFTFRLERVRSLRERAEEQAKEALARGLTHRAAGETLLRRASDAAANARDLTSGTALRPGGASALDLMAAQAFLERTQREHQAAALELDRRDTEVEARRTALTAAARDREVVERLREQARARHEGEVARVAQVELDEIALSVHRRAKLGVAA